MIRTISTAAISSITMNRVIWNVEQPEVELRQRKIPPRKLQERVVHNVIERAVRGVVCCGHECDDPEEAPAIAAIPAALLSGAEASSRRGRSSEEVDHPGGEAERPCRAGAARRDPSPTLRSR